MTDHPASAPVPDDYGRRLRKRLADMDALWAEAQTGNETALHDLHRHAHQLRGSARMYGYAEIDDAARLLDLTLSSFRSEGAALEDPWAERIGRSVKDLLSAGPLVADDVPDALPDPLSDEASILIADDDPTVRAVLAAHLKEAGFHTLEAPDGASAVAMARSERPDVVVMDLHMPGMGGTEAIETLRAQDATREIPIVVLTAHDDTETVLRVLSLNVDGYLVKPAAPEDVVGKVFDTLFSAQ